MISLVDARKSLEQHRRLLVVGGWFALLQATLHIGLRQDRAGDAYLTTAAALAEQASDFEIVAWCWETRAWNALTGGDYRAALALSLRAQAVAPPGRSAIIQASAQEGRARARLGDRPGTRYALDRVERFVSTVPVPDHPEHHYQDDPAKGLSYAATTLSWVGDPAAVAVAALESGRIVGSNWWRATELVAAVRRSGVPEFEDLRDAYDAHKPAG